MSGATISFMKSHIPQESMYLLLKLSVWWSVRGTTNPGMEVYQK